MCPLISHSSGATIKFSEVIIRLLSHSCICMTLSSSEFCSRVIVIEVLFIVVHIILCLLILDVNDWSMILLISLKERRNTVLTAVLPFIYNDYYFCPKSLPDFTWDHPIILILIVVRREWRRRNSLQWWILLNFTSSSFILFVITVYLDFSQNITKIKECLLHSNNVSSLWYNCSLMFVNKLWF
jgi:hypothetical protein